MKNKYILLILGILVMTCLSSMVFAAPTCTIDDPSSGGVISGTVKINTTITNTAGNYNISNITWIYTTGGSSTTIGQNNTLVDGTGNNANYSNANITLATKALYDNLVYTVTAQLYNESDGDADFSGSAISGATCTQTFYVDNGAPACSISVPVSSTTYKQSISASATATNSSKCVWTVTGNGAVTYTGTISGSAGSETCTYSFDPTTISEGTYTVAVDLWDYGASAADNDKTSCTSKTGVIFQSGGKAKPVIVTTSNNEPAFSVVDGKDTPVSGKSIVIFGGFVIGLILIGKYGLKLF